MKLLRVYLTWFAMAAVLATGIVLAVKGSPWLLILGFLGFIVAFAKLGCLDNH
jgi:membrane protein implicated in regulation of membrane protease activity